MRPSQEFRVKCVNNIYFRGEQSPNYEWYRETKTILGIMDKKNTFGFHLRGTQEQVHFRKSHSSGKAHLDFHYVKCIEGKIYA